MSLLVTGEAVPVDLRVARVGSRSVAAALDLLLQFAVFGLLAGVFGVAAPDDPALLSALLTLDFIIVFIGYPLLMELTWDGRTLGKAALGIKARRDDGGPLRFRHALVRAVLGGLVEKPGATLGIAAVVCSLASSRGKRLGDALAGTVVVQERVPQTGGWLPPIPPPLIPWAQTLDLSRLTDELALSVRQFLGRAHQLDEQARENLGQSLVAKVSEVVTPPPPPGTPGWAYLTAVLTERRRRAEQAWRSAQPPMPSAPPAWAAPGNPYGRDAGPYAPAGRPAPPEQSPPSEPGGPFAPPA